MTVTPHERTRDCCFSGVLLLLVVSLTGCHTARVAAPPTPPPQSVAAPAQSPAAEQPPAEEPPSADEPQPTVETIPPCLPVPEFTTPPPKRKPKPAQHPVSPPPAEQTAPSPPAAEPQPAVKQLQVSLGSILGKKVQDAEGDDFGRVVDVLADSNGRVRLAIIEYGGFLGLGDRRVAVDWALLRFHPEDPERPATLPVSEKKLRAIPEFKAPTHPQALIAPAIPEADGKK
jgi:hypothetical protein